jgi:hypothetical protein
LIAGGTAVLWLAVFNFDMWLFAHTDFTERAHWIFLPEAFHAPIAYHNIDTLGYRNVTTASGVPLSH